MSEPFYQLTADKLIGGRWLPMQSVALYLHRAPEQGKVIVNRPGFPAPSIEIDGAPVWDIVAVEAWAQHHRHADPKTYPTCLYRHFSKAGELLYVGISMSAVQRTGQHKVGKAWFREVANITVEWFESRKEAEAAELRAIRSERPLYNLRGVAQ